VNQLDNYRTESYSPTRGMGNEIKSLWWEVQVPPEDIQAVREVTDMVNADEGDRYPENYMKLLPACALFPDL